MSAIFYRCLPNYQQRCDCSLTDLMLGKDCGVLAAQGGAPTQIPQQSSTARLSPAPGSQSGGMGTGTTSMEGG